MRVWLQLSRWQEFVPFVLPLTVLGALLARNSRRGRSMVACSPASPATCSRSPMPSC